MHRVPLKVPLSAEDRTCESLWLLSFKHDFHFTVSVLKIHPFSTTSLTASYDFFSSHLPKLLIVTVILWNTSIWTELYLFFNKSLFLRVQSVDGTGNFHISCGRDYIFLKRDTVGYRIMNAWLVLILWRK